MKSFFVFLFFIFTFNTSGQLLNEGTRKNHSLYNSNGRLKDDVPEYNTKSPLWVPAAYVAGTNLFIWSIDRLVLDKEYSVIGTTTWKTNI